MAFGLISMIQASSYYKMYWIWLIVTSPNEYLLDRGLGLVAEGIDCQANLKAIIQHHGTTQNGALHIIS